MVLAFTATLSPPLASTILICLSSSEFRECLVRLRLRFSFFTRRVVRSLRKAHFSWAAWAFTKPQELLWELTPIPLRLFQSQSWFTTQPQPWPFYLAAIARELAYLKEEEGSPASWFQYLSFLLARSACRVHCLRSEIFASRTLTLRGWFISRVFFGAAFPVLSRVPCLFDTIFTALLNYRYFFALALQHLLLFLLKSALDFLLSLFLSFFPLLLSWVLLSLFLSHFLHSQSLHFHLTRLIRTLIWRRVSSMRCLYFLSSRLWKCSIVSYSLASFIPGAG